MKERVKKLCHKKKLLHMFQRPFKTAVSRKAFSHIPKATHAYCECKEYIPYFLGDQVLLTPVNQSLVPLDTRLLCLRELRSPHLSLHLQWCTSIQITVSVFGDQLLWQLLGSGCHCLRWHLSSNIQALSSSLALQTCCK